MIKTITLLTEVDKCLVGTLVKGQIVNTYWIKNPMIYTK